MLNRTKLITQVQDVSSQLFVSFASEHNIARGVWKRIANDPTFASKAKAADLPWRMPTWSGKLDETFEVEPGLMAYHAVSVDGSQIYPDRHQGTACYLINVGSVVISYGTSGFPVHLDSVPYVFAGEAAHGDLAISPEYVNCLRQEYEFAAGLELSKKIKEERGADIPLVFLFDGSLIFWHLASKEEELKQAFLSRYMALLQSLYVTQTLCAGYISLPKGKDLVNLIRAALCEFDAASTEAHTLVDHVVDTTVADFFLRPFTRSIVFKSTSEICSEYPPHLQPHFFYLHVGDEIARIELPAWIAENDEYITTIARVMVDQALKGRGYPVVIAEAHEQAVVKGPDREFFYQLIAKCGIEQKQRLTLSCKSMRKRGIGI